MYDTLDCRNLYCQFVLICVALPFSAIDTNVNNVLTILNVVLSAITSLNADDIPTTNGRTRYGSERVKRKRRYVGHIFTELGKYYMKKSYYMIEEDL